MILTASSSEPRHNSYRVKNPGNTIIRHDGPVHQARQPCKTPGRSIIKI